MFFPPLSPKVDTNNVQQSPKRHAASGSGAMGGSPEDTPMGSPNGPRNGDSDDSIESEGEGDVSGMQDDE